MTVCIAALAENRRKVVVAADNMYTHGVGNFQYQREDNTHKKIYKLGNNVCALTAGAHHIINPVIVESKKIITETSTPEEAAEIIRSALQDFYLAKVEQEILKPVGIDWQIFRTRQNELSQIFLTQVIDSIKNFNLDINIIIAGFNQRTDTGYLGIVGGSGFLIDQTIGGFITNGVGGEIAKYSILLSKYNDTLNTNDVVKIVKKGIRDAKKSPGVGELGDFFILPEVS